MVTWKVNQSSLIFELSRVKKVWNLSLRLIINISDFGIFVTFLGFLNFEGNCSHLIFKADEGGFLSKKMPTCGFAHFGESDHDDSVLEVEVEV